MSDIGSANDVDAIIAQAEQLQRPAGTRRGMRAAGSGGGQREDGEAEEGAARTSVLAGARHAALLAALAGTCIAAPSYVTAVYVLLFLGTCVWHQVWLADRSYRRPHTVVLALAAGVSGLHFLALSVINIIAAADLHRWTRFAEPHARLLHGFGLWVDSPHDGDTAGLIETLIPSFFVCLASGLWLAAAAPRGAGVAQYRSWTLVQGACSSMYAGVLEAEAGSSTTDVTPGLSTVLMVVQTAMTAGVCIVWPKVVTAPYFVLFVVMAVHWAVGARGGALPPWFAGLNTAAMGFSGLSIAAQFVLQLDPLDDAAADLAELPWLGVVRINSGAAGNDVDGTTRWRYYAYLACLYAMYYIEAVRLIPINHLQGASSLSTSRPAVLSPTRAATGLSSALRPLTAKLATVLKQQALHVLFICLAAAALVSVSLLSGVWLLVMLFFMSRGVNLTVALVVCAIHCTVLFVANVGVPETQATNLVGLTVPGHNGTGRAGPLAALVCLLLVIALARRFNPTTTEPLGQQLAKYVRRIKSFYALPLFLVVVTGCNMVDALHSVLIVLFFVLSLCAGPVRRRFWPVLVFYQAALALFLYNYNVVCMLNGEPAGMAVVVDHPFTSMWELLPYLVALLLSIVQLFVYRGVRAMGANYERSQGFKTKDEARAMLHLKLFLLRVVCFGLLLALPPSVMTLGYLFLSVCLTWIPAVDRIEGSFIAVFIVAVLMISALNFLSLYLFQFDQVAPLHTLLCDSANVLLGCPLSADANGHDGQDANATAHDRSPCVEQFGLWSFGTDAERTIGLLLHWCVVAVGVSLMGDRGHLRRLLERLDAENEFDEESGSPVATTSQSLPMIRRDHTARSLASVGTPTHRWGSWAAVYRGFASVGDALHHVGEAVRPATVVVSQYLLFTALFLAGSASKSLPTAGYFVLLLIALLSRRRKSIYVTVLAYSTLCLGVRLLFQFTFFPGRDHLGSAWEAYLDLRPLGTAWTCAAVAEDAARCASLPGCAFADGACDSAAWSRQLFLIVPYVWTDIFVLLAAKLCLRCVHWVRTSSAEPGAARATYDNRVAGLTCFNHPSNAGGGAAGCDDAASKTSKAEAGGARAYTEADVARIVHAQACARRWVARRRWRPRQQAVRRGFKEGAKVALPQGVVYRIQRAEWICRGRGGGVKVVDVRAAVNAALQNGGLELCACDADLLPEGGKQSPRAEPASPVSLDSPQYSPSQASTSGWWSSVFTKGKKRLEIDYVPVHGRDAHQPWTWARCAGFLKRRQKDAAHAWEVTSELVAAAVDFGFAAFSFECTLAVLLLLSICQPDRLAGLLYLVAFMGVAKGKRRNHKLLTASLAIVGLQYCIAQVMYIGLPETIAWGPFPQVTDATPWVAYWRYVGTAPSRGSLFGAAAAVGMLAAHNRLARGFRDTPYYDAANVALYGASSLTAYLTYSTKQVHGEAVPLLNILRTLHEKGRLPDFDAAMFQHLLRPPVGVHDDIRDPHTLRGRVRQVYYAWLPALCLMMIFYDSCEDALITVLRMGKLALGIQWALQFDRVLDSDVIARRIIMYFAFCAAVHILWNAPFLARMIHDVGATQDFLLFIGVMRCPGRALDWSHISDDACMEPELTQFDITDALCILLLFLHRLNFASWRYVYVVYQWHEGVLLAEERRQVMSALLSERQQRYDDMSALMEWEMRKARQRAEDELECTHRIVNAYPLVKLRESNRHYCYQDDSDFSLRALHDDPELPAEERAKRKMLRDVFLDGWLKNDPPPAPHVEEDVAALVARQPYFSDPGQSWHRKLRLTYEHGMSDLIRLPTDLTGRLQEDTAFLRGLLEGPHHKLVTPIDEALLHSETQEARNRRAYERGKAAAAPGSEETNRLIALAGAFAAYATFFKRTPSTAKVALLLNQQSLFAPLVGVWTVYDVYAHPVTCLRQSVNVFCAQHSDLFCYLIFTINFGISGCVLDMIPSLASYLYAILCHSHPRSYWVWLQRYIIALLAIKCLAQAAGLSFQVSVVSTPWLFGHLTADSFFFNALGDFISILAIKWRMLTLNKWGASSSQHRQGGRRSVFSDDECSDEEEEDNYYTEADEPPAGSSGWDGHETVSQMAETFDLNSTRPGTGTGKAGGVPLTSSLKRATHSSHSPGSSPKLAESGGGGGERSPDQSPLGMTRGSMPAHRDGQITAQLLDRAASAIRFVEATGAESTVDGTERSPATDTATAPRGSRRRQRGAEGTFLSRTVTGMHRFFSDLTRRESKEVKRGPPVLPMDLYLPSVVLDLVSLLLFILLYSSLMGKSGLVIVSAVQENVLPGMLVLGMLVMVLCMLGDRICYLTASMPFKFAHHVSVVLLGHLALFGWGLKYPDMPGSAHVAGVAIFVVRAFYFIASAKQLKHKYPKFRYDCFQGSSSPNVAILYTVFRGIPFLYEMRVLLDWACSPTVLAREQWLKLEGFRAEMFTRRVEIDLTKDYQPKPGDRYPKIYKICPGWVIVVLMLVLVFFPLGFYSTFSPALKLNSAKAVEIEIGFDNEPPFYRNSLSIPVDDIAKDTDLARDLSKTRPSLDKLQIEGDDENVQLLTFTDFSHQRWSITIAAVEAMVARLQNGRTTAPALLTKVSVTRTLAPLGAETLTSTARYTMLNHNATMRSNLADLLLWNGTHTVPPPKVRLAQFIAPIVFNKPNGLLFNAEKVDCVLSADSGVASDGVQKFFTMNCTSLFACGNRVERGDNEYDCVTDRDACPDYDTSPPPQCQRGEEPETEMPLYFAVISDVASDKNSLLSGLFDVGIVALYVTVVLNVNTLLRGMLTGSGVGAFIQDMNDPTFISNLADFVHLARWLQDPALEQHLYLLLLNLLRSPETLMRITGLRRAPRLGFKKRKRLARPTAADPSPPPPPQPDRQPPLWHVRPAPRPDPAADFTEARQETEPVEPVYPTAE